MGFRWFFRLAALFMVLIVSSPITHADSWMPPKPSVTYESEARDARFLVTTSVRPDVISACNGTLYLKDSAAGKAEWTRIWNQPLQNQVSPVTALVANGGWRVVTFDNYYSAGYGEEVIVFYDETGKLLKKYSLESLLSEAELIQIPRSLSSRWWRSSAVIDDSLGLLKVEVALRRGGTPSIKPLSFHLQSGEVAKP